MSVRKSTCPFTGCLKQFQLNLNETWLVERYYSLLEVVYLGASLGMDLWEERKYFANNSTGVTLKYG